MGVLFVVGVCDRITGVIDMHAVSSRCDGLSRWIILMQLHVTFASVLECYMYMSVGVASGYGGHV